MRFEAKTKNRNIDVDAYSGFINNSDVQVNKTFFSNMCKSCRNYNAKYSCPPKSPSFDAVCKNEGIFVVMLKCSLADVKSTEYNKVRIANSVLKSRIENLMRHLEEKFNTKFLGSGSCRLCKPCNLKKGLPCRHPDRMRYSLESVGVDCNHLSTFLFNTPLLWYKDSRAPVYACVLAGLPCSKKDAKSAEDAFKLYIRSSKA